MSNGFFDGLLVGMGAKEKSPKKSNKTNTKTKYSDLNEIFGVLDNDNDDLAYEAVYCQDTSQQIFRKAVLENTESNNGWYTCPRCGKKFRASGMQADHILPRSQGGLTVRSNGQMLCAHCNHSKQDNTKDTEADYARRKKELNPKATSKITRDVSDAMFLKHVSEMPEFKRVVEKRKTKNLKNKRRYLLCIL